MVVDNPRVKEYIYDDVEPEEQAVDEDALEKGLREFPVQPLVPLGCRA